MKKRILLSMLATSLALPTTSQELSGVDLGPGWYVRTSGRTSDVPEGGGFVIPNVSPAFVQTVVGGPLTVSPCQRVEGVARIGAQWLYARSAPFSILEGTSAVARSFTFYASAPPAPVGGRLLVDDPVLVPGQTTQVRLVVDLSDGSSLDVTGTPCALIVSAPDSPAGTVDPQGVFHAPATWPDGVPPGVISTMVAALYEDWTFSAEVCLDGTGTNPSPTTIVGFCLLEDGSPAVGAQVVLNELFLTTQADADGRFELPDVAPEAGPFSIRATLDLGGSSVSATVVGLEGVPGGMADAGVLVLGPPKVGGPRYDLYTGDGFGALLLCSDRRVEGVVSQVDSRPRQGGDQPLSEPFATFEVGPTLHVADTVIDTVIRAGGSCCFSDDDQLEGTSFAALQLASEEVPFTVRWGQQGDTCLAIPRDSLGTCYRVLAVDDFQGFGDLGIVASADGTNVIVTPTVPLPVWNGGPRVDLHPPGEPYHFTLDEGEQWHSSGWGSSYSAPGESMTGALVQSDKPVAVFVVCNAAPGWDPDASSCNPISQSMRSWCTIELPPVEAWGTEFALLSLAGRQAGDLVRVVAHEEGTSVVYDDGVSTTSVELAAGGHATFDLRETAWITSSKPILVGQFGKSRCVEPSGYTGLGMLVPPIGAYAREHRFSTYFGYNADFVLDVVVPSEVVGRTVLDGQPIPAASFTPIGASGFSATHVALSQQANPPFHLLESPQPCMAWCTWQQQHIGTTVAAGCATAWRFERSAAAENP